MSASSTSTYSKSCVKSLATVNSTGDCSEAATVCPGSTSRASTTPSIGDLMVVQDSEVSASFSEARDNVACDCEDATLASARSASACAASSSLLEMSPLSAISLARASAALDCANVALARRTEASAALT